MPLGPPLFRMLLKRKIRIGKAINWTGWGTPFLGSSTGLPMQLRRDLRAFMLCLIYARRDHLPGVPPSRLRRQVHAATCIIVFAVR